MLMCCLGCPHFLLAFKSCGFPHLKMNLSIYHLSSAFNPSPLASVFQVKLNGKGGFFAQLFPEDGRLRGHLNFFTRNKLPYLPLFSWCAPGVLLSPHQDNLNPELCISISEFARMLSARHA